MDTYDNSQMTTVNTISLKEYEARAAEGDTDALFTLANLLDKLTRYLP